MASPFEDLERRILALERPSRLTSLKSRRLRVTFPAANTQRDIAHGLGGIPSGYWIEWADGELHATPGVLWTTDLAFLQANAANVHAVITFYIATEDATDAS